ncbi:MAG TPA: hypothetical protein ENI05_09245 [Porticoccus sp.]|nr:hypothetical protein [Porticoccus sp.]
MNNLIRSDKNVLSELGQAWVLSLNPYTRLIECIADEYGICLNKMVDVDKVEINNINDDSYSKQTANYEPLTAQTSCRYEDGSIAICPVSMVGKSSFADLVAAQAARFSQGVVARLDDLEIGSHVYIKGYKGGYLRDVGGVLSAHEIIEGDEFVWQVEVSAVGTGLMFINLATQRNLKNDVNGPNASKVVVTTYPTPSTFLFYPSVDDGHVDYTHLESVWAAGKCLDANNKNDDSIVSKDCNPEWEAHKWQFEVLPN